MFRSTYQEERAELDGARLEGLRWVPARRARPALPLILAALALAALAAAAALALGVRP
ncbi:hypothetical protein [Phenylobacterium sp.]|uniref:hypothetical protein n=1 Tax=Phenylobacterium sp. TaxID=1871053 RepID=UPI0025D7D32D|nr:hypothetical protein [Phenylobacterium sp.]MBX3482506.1 hypothetical protein [Phenylobacterium sp.]